MSRTTSGAFGVWKTVDFRLLTGGQLLSQLGNQAQGLALPLIVLALTGSTAQAGLLLGVSTSTYLIAGLFAGALVDRWNRKRLMIWCEVGRAALTASIPVALLLDALTMTQLYLVAVLTGGLAVLFQAANSAALPHVVRPAQLSQALAAYRAAGSAVSIAGAALAGAAYAVGRAVPFVVNAASFALSALSLRAIRSEFQDSRPPLPGTRRMLRDIAEGLAWVAGQPVIRLLAVVEAADGVRYGAGYLIIIQLAHQAGANVVQVGLVFSGAAVGGLLGGLVAARFTPGSRLGRLAITMLWTEALAFPLYAVAPTWWWLALVALLESVVTPIYSVAMDTFRIAITPDALRGRVNSALGTLVTGATAIGTVVGGELLARIGAVPLTLVCAGWLLLLAAISTASATLRSASVR